MHEIIRKAAGLFCRKVCLVGVPWCSGNTCLMTHLFELWIYVFHAIWRIWGSDMLKSNMIYSLQTSASHDFSFTLMASGVPFRSYCISSIYLLLAIFYCILLCSFHCEVHEHAKHMTFTTSSGVSSKGVYILVGQSLEVNHHLLEDDKKPLLKYGCFGNPTGLLKKVAKDFFRNNQKRRIRYDSVWSNYSDLTRVLGPQMVV